MRLINRASMEGLATPVTVVKSRQPRSEGSSPALCSATAESLLSQFLRYPDPDIVGLAPGLDIHVLLRGNRKVAAIHGHVAVQPRQQQRILEFGSPIILQAFEKNFLRVVMFREGACRAGNPHGFCVLN